MINLHDLSHGSSSAFLYDQFTRPLTWFLLCFLLWSVYTASHMVPPLLSCMISLHGLSHGSSAFLYDQFYTDHTRKQRRNHVRGRVNWSYKKAEEPCERPCTLIIQESRGTKWEAVYTNHTRKQRRKHARGCVSWSYKKASWFLCFLVWWIYTTSHMVPPLLSCMISLHCLSHGSSFLVCSVYTASHMVLPTLSCMINLHSLSHVSSSAFLYD
jgi:hypothetical protein